MLTHKELKEVVYGIQPTLLKHGDIIKIKGKRRYLDQLDTSFNLAPPGMLWVRNLGDVSPTAGEFVEGPKEVFGIVNIMTEKFYPLTNIDTFVVNIQDKEMLARLFFEAFPEPPTFFQRMKKNVVDFFLKIRDTIKSKGNKNE